MSYGAVVPELVVEFVLPKGGSNYGYVDQIVSQAVAVWYPAPKLRLKDFEAFWRHDLAIRQYETTGYKGHCMLHLVDAAKQLGFME